MKVIAEVEFESIPMYDSLRKQLTGPVMTDKRKYLEFKWYKVLEWGDTAALYIDIFKCPNSFSWRDDFFWPKTTMDWQWYYFLFPNGTSRFKDILPKQYDNTLDDVKAFKLFHHQEKVIDSINFIVNPERLFFFLSKGYFEVVDKQANCVVVDFYEPIANIIHKQTNDTVFTMSAKVFLNDSLEVSIMPYIVPVERRNQRLEVVSHNIETHSHYNLAAK